MSATGSTAAGRRALVAGALALALAGGGVAACSGGRSSSSDAAASVAGRAAGGSAAGPALAPALPAAPTAGAAGSEVSPAAAPGTAAQVALATAARSRILTAAVDLAVPDVPRAVLLVTARTTAAGGFIGTEDMIAASRTQGALATMTLRVPDERFDAVLTAVSVGMGTVRSSTRSAADVTGQVADLDSRLASDRASITRVRLLFARARASVRSSRSSRRSPIASRHWRVSRPRAARWPVRSPTPRSR